MVVQENGAYYNQYRLWESKLNQPYDYRNEGLIKRILSHKIYNSKNRILQYILNTVEQSMIYCMSYIDILQNWYNYNWKNR